MVIRGGGGVFYNRFSESSTLQANRFNGVNQQQFFVSELPLYQCQPNSGPPPNTDSACSFTDASGQTVLGQFVFIPPIPTPLDAFPNVRI
jgi:hypothetical protein